MKVSTSNPFQKIYSLFEHEYLGYLLESFVVQLDDKGKLTKTAAKNAVRKNIGFDFLSIPEKAKEKLVKRRKNNVISEKMSMVCVCFNLPASTCEATAASPCCKRWRRDKFQPFPGIDLPFRFYRYPLNQPLYSEVVFGFKISIGRQDRKL